MSVNQVWIPYEYGRLTTEKLSAERAKVFERISESKESILNAVKTVTPSDSSNESNNKETPEQINATVNDNVQLQILEILKEMKKEFAGNWQQRRRWKKSFQTPLLLSWYQLLLLVPWYV